MVQREGLLRPANCANIWLTRFLPLQGNVLSLYDEAVNIRQYYDRLAQALSPHTGYNMTAFGTPPFSHKVIRMHDLQVQLLSQNTHSALAYLLSSSFCFLFGLVSLKILFFFTPSFILLYLVPFFPSACGRSNTFPMRCWQAHSNGTTIAGCGLACLWRLLPNHTPGGSSS